MAEAGRQAHDLLVVYCVAETRDEKVELHPYMMVSAFRSSVTPANNAHY